jgi:hypothetical protein
MSVTKRPPLSPLDASRAEQDAYARKTGGLTSTGTNMGAATRNRMTPPTTQVPQPPTPPASPGDGTPQSTGSVLNTPSGPVLVANLVDIGQCKPGDQVSYSVLSVQNGQVELGNPLVLPGTPAGASTSQGSGALQ